MTATGEIDHGTYRGYATQDCRCDLCRAANTEYNARRRAERRAAPLPASIPHGRRSTYANWGCRCGPCTTANTEACGWGGAMSEEAFWGNVEKSDGCWLWTGTLNHRGYGICVGGRVHRVAYELLVGPIPEGLVLDHTCHTEDLTCNLGDACPHRRCVNPAHLEPVTTEENIRRGRRGSGHGQEPHCPQGHPYSGENLRLDKYGHRHCRTCHNAENRRYQARKKERLGSTPGAPSTTP